MTRRRILCTAAFLAVTGLLTACAGNGPGAAGAQGSDNPQNVRVYLASDTNIQELWEDTLIPAFTAANPDIGVEVQFDLHGNNQTQTVAKLAAADAQGADPGIDIVEGDPAQQAGAADLLVDPAGLIPGLSAVAPDIVAAAGPGAVPYRASSVLLAYDSTKVPNPPRTLDELLAWIKANPGQFTYNSPKTGGSGQAFVTTVLDKFVPPDVRAQMTTGYHKDLESHWDEGWRTLQELNQYVFQGGVYPNGNNGTLELLASGQVSMSPVWSDQFLTGQRNGTIPPTVKALQISDPPFTGGATPIGIVKASDRQENAAKLIDFLLQPAQQQAIAEKIAGYPVIPLDQLSEEVRTAFGDARPDQLRPTYFTDHKNDLNNLWDQLVPGH
ncbi:MAG TPA: extracellular solute-binding protein [Pseudonocardia sp.]|uniref:extracellular solute-binding protein n=1 Tax=Pseudonocardia sp. TaxID=60912 RepID=UPI002B4B943A|nr:extracellular solute-binding protein [Pseudonocardia sp.]HLU54102.1 extracellular solute-binding protein [Pseudonocardia sp.]